MKYGKIIFPWKEAVENFRIVAVPKFLVSGLLYTFKNYWKPQRDLIHIDFILHIYSLEIWKIFNLFRNNNNSRKNYKHMSIQRLVYKYS